VGPLIAAYSDFAAKRKKARQRSAGGLLILVSERFYFSPEESADTLVTW
jgi:hypothetical protein